MITDKTRLAIMRDLAFEKVKSGYYKTLDAILDEFKGKVCLYRQQGSADTPTELRLKPATVDAWTESAKVYCEYAVAFFKRAQTEVTK